MLIESLVQDTKYALRGIRRAPLFAAGVAGTIGLGLGVVCSAFTIVNAYLLKPIDLPNPYQLYELSWDTAAIKRHGFRLADVEALRAANPVFSDILAGDTVTVMHDGTAVAGQIVTANYFELLGARALLGRTLLPEDAARPGERAVVVLSHDAWTWRYGADPTIVGKEISLGRHRYQVVGVTQPGFSLPGAETIGFWVPLTMARDFAVPDPWTSTDVYSLFVIGRLRSDATLSHARAWFDVWVRQRFPTGSDAAPITVRVDSKATRIPVQPKTTTMFALIVSAFGLVLLVACANVANMMLARGLTRQREIAVRLSLGAERARVVRQLLVESLVLALPAALFGLGLTVATSRVFPALILATFPAGLPPANAFLMPLDPDTRVLAFLFVASLLSAILFGLSPAIQLTRTSLARAAKGEFGIDTRVSQLRNSLVVVQIAVCSLFLMGALGLVDESRRMARTETGLDYDRVSDVRVPADLRAAVAERLAAEPSIERLAVAWRPPLYGPLWKLHVLPSGSSTEQAAGFLVVSPEYFDLFGIGLERGRVFTGAEADENADVIVVSASTARRFWPGQEAVGQSLEIVPEPGRAQRLPPHSRVRVVGVAADVMSGALIDAAVDPTCVYFATTPASPGEAAILVRARAEITSVKTLVSTAVDGVRPDAAFELFPMRQVVGLQVWAFQAFSAAASFLAMLGLLLAFSGTYSVVGYLVTQRTREFGIRLALGARVETIVGGMLREALRFGAAGIGAGAVIAVGLSRFFESMTDITPAFGPEPYIAGAAAVALATLVAAFVPSRRAARIDPSAALRSE